MTPAEIFAKVRPHTMSPQSRLESMMSIFRKIDAEKIAGDVVECGVWRGGNIMMARLMLPERTCWLYDTFDGMTEPDPVFDTKRSGEKAIDRWNLKKKGGTKWDAVDVEEVKDAFFTMGPDLLSRCNFVIGDVEETVDARSHEAGIAVLRLDVDWYRPTKSVLKRLVPKITPGGFLIVDDYGHWLGCRRAVDEYFGGSRPKEEKEVDYSCVVFRC